MTNQLDDDEADLLGVPRSKPEPAGLSRADIDRRRLARTPRIATSTIEKAGRILDRHVDRIKGKGVETGDFIPLNIADVQHGVTVGTLGQIFRMDPITVRKRLRDCAPIANRTAGYVYDLGVAAQYLVRPALKIEEYMKTMKVSEMPAHLQDNYWSAMRKKQEWEERAGHLWRTEKVVEVLSDVFQTIKFSMQLWPDNLERMKGLSPDQRGVLVTMLDGLQTELYEKLKDLGSKKNTKPTLSEIEGMVEPIWAEDDDDSDVI